MRRLFLWGRANRRKFPWRETKDPFRVLIAEVLLQRSRATTVAGVYGNLFKRWPTPKGLASAPLRELEEVVRPAGLIGRARKLKEMAETIDDMGEVPSSLRSLLRLPGVGTYAAAATMSVAFGKRAPVVDSVTARVYRRVFLGDPRSGKDESLSDIIELVGWATPRRNAREWNWAVLDLASAICLPRNPRCQVCPLVGCCRYGMSIRNSVAGSR